MIPYDFTIPNRDHLHQAARVKPINAGELLLRFVGKSSVHLGTYALMTYTKQRYDEVIHELEQERQRLDEDLRRLTVSGCLTG
jgi:hypothetical protein